MGEKVIPSLNLKCDPSFELRGEYAINPKGFHMSKIHSGAWIDFLMAMSLISVRTNKSFLRFGFPKV
jgi:hypothetical protein